MDGEARPWAMAFIVFDATPDGIAMRRVLRPEIASRRAIGRGLLVRAG